MDGDGFSFDQAQAEIQKRLEQLEEDHRKLDQTIADLHDRGADALGLQRMKREKLRLKEEIHTLRDVLVPDIIA